MLDRLLGPIKRQLAPWLHRAGLLSGASTCWARFQPVMRIVMLHGVGDPEYPVDLFKSHVEYLARHFDIVPLDQLLSRAAVASHRPRRELALTFDDGLRNNVTRVLPILRRLGAPATFYVCPGNMEEGCWIWTIEARVRLRHLGQGAREELAQHWGLDSAAVEAMQGWMKTLQNAARLRVFGELVEGTRDYRPTAEHRDWYDVMGWDDLLSLDPGLITVGSHSVSHPMLSGCSPEQRDREIGESQEWLERELGRPVRHFCYPDADLDEDVVRRVQARYDSAVSCDGLIRPGRVDLYRLPRVPAADDLAYFAWRLHNPTA